MVVEDINLGIGDGATDGVRAMRLAKGDGGIGSGFAGAVEIEDLLDGGVLIDLLDQTDGERFASEVDDANGRRNSVGFDQFGDGGRDGVDESDAGFGGESREMEGVFDEHHFAAGAEGDKDFKDGEVKADGSAG